MRRRLTSLIALTQLQLIRLALIQADVGGPSARRLRLRHERLRLRRRLDLGRDRTQPAARPERRVT